MWHFNIFAEDIYIFLERFYFLIKEYYIVIGLNNARRNQSLT